MTRMEGGPLSQSASRVVAPRLAGDEDRGRSTARPSPPVTNNRRKEEQMCKGKIGGGCPGRTAREEGGGRTRKEKKKLTVSGAGGRGEK